MKLNPAMRRVLDWRHACAPAPLAHTGLPGGDKIAAHTLSRRGFLRGVELEQVVGLGWRLSEIGARVAERARAELESIRTSSGRCRRCGRVLTDPRSVRRGIGPECYGREPEPAEPEARGPVG